MDRILEICREKGVTQVELAKRLRVSRQTLHAMLRGDARISSVQKIADALGVHITELFDRPNKGDFTCPNCGARLDVELRLKR